MPTGTATPLAVKVTFVGLIVLWSSISLKPMWTKAEMGTPVELLAGPVMLALTVGATVSTAIALVATAVMVGSLALISIPVAGRVRTKE